MLNIKNKIWFKKNGLTIKSLAGVVGLVLIAVMCIGAFSNTLATSEIVSSGATATVELDGTNSGAAVVYVEAATAGIIDNLKGNFSVHDDTTGEGFELVSIEHSEKIDAYIQEELPTTGSFWFKEATNGVEFAAGERIFTATYMVAADTPAGTYSVPFNVSEVSRNVDVYEGVTAFPVTIEVTRPVEKTDIAVTDAEVINKVFDGTAVASAGEVTFSGLPENVTLVEDEDYTTVAYFDDANVGTGKDVTVTATLIGEAAETYNLTQASIMVHADIEPLEIVANNVTLLTTEYTYSGSVNEPLASVVVSAYGGETTLISGDDYEISYSEDTVNVGDKTATITGKGNYTGSVAKEYVVNPYTLTAANVTLEYTTVRWSGTAKEPSVTVKIGDYTVPAANYAVVYANNIAVSTNENKATVTVTLQDTDNIVGEPIVKEFTIIDKETLTISGISDQNVVYTGEPVVLVGTLAVAENEDDIKVSDLITKWYNTDNEEISQPTNVGAYYVIYSYDGVNYNGQLKVDFNITKAESVVPEAAYAERMGVKGAELETLPLNDVENLSWADGSDVIQGGLWVYAAKYTTNGDTANYETASVAISVFGLDFETEVEVLSGEEQVYVKGDEAGARFRFDADYNLFETGGRVYVDSERLSAEDYTSKAGSTVIVLAAEYLENLEDGEHQLVVLFNNGLIAGAEFTTETPADEPVVTPDTGIFTGEKGMSGSVIILPAVVLTVVALGVLYSRKGKKVDFNK